MNYFSRHQNSSKMSGQLRNEFICYFRPRRLKRCLSTFAALLVTIATLTVLWPAGPMYPSSTIDGRKNIVSNRLERPIRVAPSDSNLSNSRHFRSKELPHNKNHRVSINRSRSISKNAYNLTRFKPRLDARQKEILFSIVAELDRVCTDTEMTYFLYGGSLLGSYRHHDIIPWDDDIDVFMNGSDMESIFRQLKSTLRPSFVLARAGHRYKLYSELGVRTSRYPWKWPYVDIQFYNENGTHIYDSAPEFSKIYAYDKETVFPLHRRPFGGLWLMSPRDAYSNLRATYRQHDCSTHYYSHRLEKVLSLRQNYVWLPCEVLSGIHPFVFRALAGNGSVVETLRLGSTELRTVVVEEPSYAITKPFKLELIDEN